MGNMGAVEAIRGRLSGRVADGRRMAVPRGLSHRLNATTAAGLAGTRTDADAAAAI